MTTDWSATSIASLLASAFAPDISCQSNATSTSSSPTSVTHRKPHSNGSARNDDDSAPPAATIDVLLTFDPSGISNHPNHRSLHHGARAFLSSLMKGKSGYTCPVTLYTLTTTNIVRKYLGALDAPISMIIGVVQGIFAGKEKDNHTTTSASNDTSIRVQESSGKESRRLLFISGISEWLKAQKAMVAGHKSQMVWFRWGWITIGRYMVVNDLKREVV
jgi:N-acetylglucosaminylphosphatidylinositol deacetylase